MSFDRDTLDMLERADEIDIETSRASGAAAHRVTIWIVVDGGAAYVRSVRGAAGRWHRDLLANPHGAVHVNGRRVAIQAAPANDPDTITRVSDALTRKYQRWPGPLASVLRLEVRSATWRLDAA